MLSTFAMQPLIGTWNTLGSVKSTFAIASTGIHFQILDLEHGDFDLHNLANHVFANNSAQSNCKLYVRIPELSRTFITQALDNGATGIVCPHIETVDQGFELSNLMSYSKKRSYSPYVPSLRNGVDQNLLDSLDFSQYPTRVGIIESSKGVENIDALIASNCFDVFYIGAYDLSVDMGFSQSDPDFVDLVHQIKSKVLNHNLLCGAFVPKTSLHVSTLIDQGFNFITYNVDVNILVQNYLNLSRII